MLHKNSFYLESRGETMIQVFWTTLYQIRGNLRVITEFDSDLNGKLMLFTVQKFMADFDSSETYKIAI